MSSRAEAKSTYFPPNSSGKMSPGLLRAREPFFLRNTITGLTLVSFATWVYWYSISAVKQDDFSGADVKLLEEQERVRREALGAALQGDVEETVGGAPLGARAATELSPSAALLGQQQASSATTTTHSHAQGTLASLFRGRSADSQLVLGAPAIDKLGTLQDPVAPRP